MVVKGDEAVYRQLIEAAKRVAELAYRPYSNYNVGAAVLTFDSKIYTGCNVENYGYSQTVHAEEAAVCNAIADGALLRAQQSGLDQFQFIRAVAVWTPKSSSAMPCFNCRQFLSEFGTEFDIVVEDERRQLCCRKFEELVPFPFAREAVVASVAGKPANGAAHKSKP